MKQSRVGALLMAYLSVGASLLATVVLKPLYLRRLGMDMYGLYIYVFSVVQYATFMDVGVTTVMVRYITECKVKKDQRGEENFAGHCLIAVVIFCAVVCVAGALIRQNLHVLLVGRTESEVRIGAALVPWMLLGIMLSVFLHYFDGFILANERYTTVKRIALLRIALKMIVIVGFILSGKGVVGIAMGDALSNAFCLLLSFVYAISRLRFRPRWHFFDRNIVRHAGGMLLWLMMQSLVLYANNSIDKILIGSMINNVAVAVYEVAMTFVGAFSELPTITNSLHLPQVTQMVVNREGPDKLTDLVIRVGRYQSILCLCMLCGFALFGRQFIMLWTGAETLAAWPLALVIMLSVYVPLVQNICLSILTAQDKMRFRSSVLFAIAVVNLGLSYVLIQTIGSLGAALGTALSLIVGECIVMNFYYKKVIGLHIGRMLRGIFKGIFPCAMIATLLCSLLLLVPFSGAVWLITEILIFLSAFALLLLIGGLTKAEKSALLRGLRRRATLT